MIARPVEGEEVAAASLSMYLVVRRNLSLLACFMGMGLVIGWVVGGQSQK